MSIGKRGGRRSIGEREEKTKKQMTARVLLIRRIHAGGEIYIGEERREEREKGFSPIREESRWALTSFI